jgi:hypothetical protein
MRASLTIEGEMQEVAGFMAIFADAHQPLQTAVQVESPDDEETHEEADDEQDRMSRVHTYLRLLELDPDAARAADERLPDSSRGSLLWGTAFALASLPDRPGFDRQAREADMHPLADYIIRDLEVPHRKGAGPNAIRIFAKSLSGMRSQHLKGRSSGYGAFTNAGPNRIGLA